MSRIRRFFAWLRTWITNYVQGEIDQARKDLEAVKEALIRGWKRFRDFWTKIRARLTLLDQRFLFWRWKKDRQIRASLRVAKNMLTNWIRDINSRISGWRNKMKLKTSWWIIQLSLLIVAAVFIKWSWVPALVVLTLVGVFDTLWITARISIPHLAEAVCFFLSPKVGRIMAQTRAGNIVLYWSNTGRTTGRRVNQETGKMEDGREKYDDSFWFKHFGAHFISFDGIYTYPIVTEMHENEDKTNGDYTETITTARSIFEIGTYRASIIFPTSEGMLLRAKFQVRSKTLHCGVALALQCWPKTMLGAVIAVLRDKFGSGEVKNLISVNHEGKIDAANSATQSTNDTEIKKILDLLKSGSTGNPSMEVLCGQEVVGLNIMEIDFVRKEDRERYLAPFLAELEKQKTITNAMAAAEKTRIDSEAEKNAAVNRASAIEEIGRATAIASKALMEAFGNDATSVAKYLAAKEIREMSGLRALGGNTIVDLSDPKGGKS